MRVSIATALIFAGLSACSAPPGPPSRAFTPPTHERINGLAPLYGEEHDSKIPDDYIVMFKGSHTHDAHFKAIGHDLSNSDAYQHYSYGYTMNLSDSSLMNTVRKDPGVLLVETNREASLPHAKFEPVEESYLRSISRHIKRYTQNTVTNAWYGLQIVAAGTKLSTPVNNNGNYDFVARAGQGVNCYVLDSGIRITHKAFQGRASNFGGAASNAVSPYAPGQVFYDDKYGHGTHVAGIIGARTWGVAPNANLINVKITNNQGRGAQTAKIAQAIIDITNEHDANKAEDPDYNTDPFAFRGSLINLSLGWQGDSNAVLYQLIAANEAGIRIYAAAGNTNVNAANVYPCANVQTDCIAAIDENYNKIPESNYGSVVAYLAPGEKIMSTYFRSDTDIAKLTGTSQATAFATGAAAIFTFWQGLVNDQRSGHYGDYVWWNSINIGSSGFSSTSNLMINTGIHSPAKYNNEPFRWAGDWPVKNHEFNGTDISSSQPALELTTFATAYAQSTLAPASGYSTVSISGSGPANIYVSTNPPYQPSSGLSTTPPSSSQGASPYCIPYQNPDQGISGYCQCSGGADYSFASGSNPCPYTSPAPASLSINPATVTGSTPVLPSSSPPPTSSPTTTSTTTSSSTTTSPPANASPVIGTTCTPDNPEWGCSQNNTVIVYCYCGNTKDCLWSSYGECQGGVADCHLDGDGGNCGLGGGACC